MAKGNRGLDITTLVGMPFTFGAIIAAYLIEKGELKALWNVPAFTLVIGGSIGLAILCNPLKMAMGIPKLFIIAFFGAVPNIKKTADLMMEIAQDARKEGLLKLEEYIPQAKSEFMRKGLQLVVDGTAPDKVQEMLDLEMFQIQTRHKTMYGIFEALGGFGPTLGIIGTVMGLVNVLNHLGGADPSELGHSIATAFIATLYGVGIANLLWLPLAAKLKTKDKLEAAEYELILEGLLSIMHGDNPAIVKEKLTAFLEVGARGDKKGGAASGQQAARA